jgi:DNA-binding MarR family transcriptional regulator
MDLMANSSTGSAGSDGEFPIGTKEYFFHLLFLTGRYRERALDPLLAEVCLSVPLWRALAAIRRIEPCTMSQLARLAGADRTTLTRSIDQLVGQGLVERWTPSHDRRVVNLALSEPGSKIYDEAFEVMRAVNARALRGIAEDQLRQSLRTLQAVMKNLADDRVDGDDLLSFGGAPPRNEA